MLAPCLTVNGLRLSARPVQEIPGLSSVPHESETR